MEPNKAEQPVDIEEIMREIRRQILSKKDAMRPVGALNLNLSGSRLPPDFYEHLYQAGMVYDQIGVTTQVSKSHTFLVGPILDRLRHKAHELVIFYVNKLASEQIQFNTHLLQAVNLLAQELEEVGE